MKNSKKIPTFITHNDVNLIFCTGRRGQINAKYDKLVELFGQPQEGDGYKVDAEWLVKFQDGTEARIYNYKTGMNYNGLAGVATEFIEEWNIGGNSISHKKGIEVEYIEALLK